MIYQIDDKYYVNISPNIYVEIELRLQGEELILVPTNKQREVNKSYQIKSIFFEQEKDRLKEHIKKKIKKEENKKEENKKEDAITDTKFIKSSKQISFKKNRRK